MAVLSIILFLCFNIIYVTSDLENPIQSWNDPMIAKYSGIYSLDYLPKTSDSAQVKKWAFAGKLDQKVNIYCPRTYGTLCTLHDKNGQTVGVMLTIPKDDMKTTTSPFRYGGSQWFSERTISSKKYYTLVIYFVNQKHLDNPGRAVEVTSIGETFRIINQSPKKSIEVPVQESKLVSQGWEKQNCEENKGTHYLYKIKGDNCQDYLPIVMLVKNSQVVGFSFIIPGTYSSSYLGKTKAGDFEKRYPNAPQCLKKWAEVQKISALYLTFVNVKDLKKCVDSESVKPPTNKKFG